MDEEWGIELDGYEKEKLSEESMTEEHMDAGFKFHLECIYWNNRHGKKPRME